MKKLISAILSLIMVLGICIPAEFEALAASPVFLFNEDFDRFATNGEPTGCEIAAETAYIAEAGEKNKHMFLESSGRISVNFPVKASLEDNFFACSFVMPEKLTSGAVSVVAGGKVFDAVKITSDRNLTTYDGKKIGSVPVGKYTIVALIKLGLLKEVEDPALITTVEVSEQLGGVEVSEEGNVSKVLTAVEEGACEVGTTYLSDTIGHEDNVRIIETVSYDVTGDIIYPVAGIVNKDATEAETAAAQDFIDFITNDDAKALYQKYGFDTNVE